MQNGAKARYEAKAQRQINIKFYPPDYELLDWLNAKENSSGYIKNLLRREKERDPQ